ncbi:MAG: zeta toxin family protein [Lamprocystis purpurea]|jgi:predicted ABC-type ATPase|uniref:zeta toxin family protein n=1 Tax=Lamprocystis purpurea TaxID=61598 RepID=UPI0003699F6C|nr:zeta toxin family protein [Lamprocystis purpurea]MBV5273663.1 zeta toxin family protein [Lamprocystis purpurea]
MITDTQPVCRIIAGPNGAGKTTFALKYLPEIAHCKVFVNADLIAFGLSPLDQERHLVAASRLFLSEIEQNVQARRDFAFETTLSGRGYLRLIRRLRSEGWRVELLYLALPAAELSILRVTERVAHGGHSIPRVAIERRFPRSLQNLFQVYARAVDHTRCFLNSGELPQLVFVQQGETLDVLEPELFQRLLSEANR